MPWFDDARRLPAEDVLGLADAEPRQPGRVVIAVPMLPRIANFDDLDPLRAEPGVSVVLVRPGEAFPADASLILIPGSKSTMADLAFLRAQGWDIDIVAHLPPRRTRPRPLRRLPDARAHDRRSRRRRGARPGVVAGLGLLDVETVLSRDKATVAVSGRHAMTGEEVTGYEIHLGVTAGADCARPMLDLGGRTDGAQSADGLVGGTYVHGLFAADGFRRAFLAGLGVPPSDLRYEATIETTLDALAAHLERHVDIDALLAISGYRSNQMPAAVTATNAKSPAFAEIDAERSSDILRSCLAAAALVEERIADDDAAVAARAGEREAQRRGHRRFRPAGVRRAVPAGVGQHHAERRPDFVSAGRRGERDQGRRRCGWRAG